MEAVSHINNVHEKDRLTLWNSFLFVFFVSKIVESLVTESLRDLYLF